MKIAGIDPSSKTGLVLLDEAGSLLDSKHLLFKKEKGCKLLHLIGQSVSSLLKEWEPTVVSIEGIGFGNPFSKVEMGQIHGIIRVECYRLGLSWWNVPPTVLKKWTTGFGGGKGKDGKQAMALAVQNRWGFTSPSDDVVDAYALAQLGLCVEKGGVGALKGVERFSN